MMVIILQQPWIIKIHPFQKTSKQHLSSYKQFKAAISMQLNVKQTNKKDAFLKTIKSENSFGV